MAQSDQSDADHVTRRLPFSAESAAVQLASSSALLAGLEQNATPALRWYCFTPPALLLGISQPLHMIDSAACAAAGVSVHRRGSGGGAVWADEKLLLLDLALPREHPLYRDDITVSYRWMGEVWVATLSDLGLAPRLISVTEARADVQALDPLLKRVCFGGLSPYEVAIGQRKVIGLAQVRQRAGLLLQCGVYLHWEPSRTAALMAASPSDRSALTERLAARVAGLDELLDRPVDDSEIFACFEANLTQLVKLTLRDSDWNADEQTVRLSTLERYAALVI